MLLIRIIFAINTIISMNDIYMEENNLNEELVVIVRAIISFFTLLILARLLGKEQISQLSFFDYVLGITIFHGTSCRFVSRAHR